MRQLQKRRTLFAGLALVLLGATGYAAGGAASNTNSGKGIGAAAPALAVGLQSAFLDACYRIEKGKSGLRADNVANGFAVQFSGAETTIKLNNGRQPSATLALTGYGWGSALAPAGKVTRVESSGKRLDRHYGAGLTEWFLNTPTGLEQGFVIAQRARQASGALHIQMTVAGGWSATGAGERVQLTHGDVTLRYAGLKAWDASGRVLPSRLRGSDAGIEIEIEDGLAVYPVTVDPTLSYQAQLIASDVAAAAQAGESVALSADGTTALVGAPVNNYGLGAAAYVFTRSSGIWSQQQKLTGGPGPGNFGYSVALASDGNTALVGSYTFVNPANQNPSQGLVYAVYAFTRSGTTWSQTQLLTSSDAAQDDCFGCSVALSDDGNTALVGARGTSFGTNPACCPGTAYMFSRSGTTWSQLQKLTAFDAIPGNGFGFSVSLAGDGKTAMVGEPFRGFGGAAYWYTLQGATWSLQFAFTSPPDYTFLAGVPPDSYGSSVALSGDGNTALMGAPGYNGGAAYAYTRASGTWSQPVKLTASDETVQDYFGAFVALSSDGKTSLVTAPFRNSRRGSVYAFTNSNGAWSQTQELAAPDAAPSQYFGISTALTSDGTSALVGQISAGGSAYVFGDPAPIAAPTQSPAPNAAGWNANDVTVTWNWSDPGGPGIDSAHCTANSVSSGEGTIPLTATCTDTGGVVGNATYTVKIDKTNPVITASAKKADGTAYTSGAWTNQTVTVNFVCADSGSGVATCPASQVFGADGVTPAAGGTAYDLAGNSASASFGPIQIDKTKPTIIAAATTSPNAVGWYRTNVMIHFTCADSLSGVSSCPADQILSTEGPSVSSTAVTAIDAAGNVSAPSNVITVKIDKTAPALNPVVSPNPVLLNNPATITSGAADALSGLASQSCGALVTNTPGTHTATCTASDIAGNTASASVNYTVNYAFAGFLSPVRNPPLVNTGNAGKTYPLQWQLRDGKGALISSLTAISSITYQSASCSSFAGTSAAIPASANGGGLRYDTKSMDYLYNWATPGTPDCYTLFLTLNSGQVFPIYFNLN